MVQPYFNENDYLDICRFSIQRHQRWAYKEDKSHTLIFMKYESYINKIIFITKQTKILVENSEEDYEYHQYVKTSSSDVK